MSTVDCLPLTVHRCDAPASSQNGKLFTINGKRKID